MLKEIFTIQNLLFLVVMLMMAGVSLKKIIKNPKEETVLPSIIAATGIIGTFFGIFIGLLKFDTGNLEASIPALLNGMKTAFFTSLIGLILSNLLKGIKSHKEKNTDNSLDDASLQTIAELMVEVKDSIVSMRKSQEMTAEQNKTAMTKLVESLVGDEETTLTTQMKMLRIDMVDAQKKAQDRLNEGLNKMGTNLNELVRSNQAISDEIKKGNKELISEFRSFAKDMAENNMKAFTEAIQECIRDLNSQLQEQFGENFKHLNYAVEKLLEWQEHYKETVERTNITQVELYKGMQEAEKLVQAIMSRTETIVEVANNLGDKIVTFDTQQQNLNNSIEVLNRISSEAVEMMPNLDRYMNKYFDDSEKLSTALHSSMEETYRNIEECVKTSDDEIKKVSIASTERITEHVIETTKKGIEEVNNASTVVLEAVHEVHEKATRELTQLSGIVDKKIDSSIDNINVLTDGLNTNASKTIDKITETTINIENQILKNAQKLDESRLEILDLTKLATQNISKQQKEIVEAIQGITNSLLESTNINVNAIEKQIQSLETAVIKLENEGFTITKKISDNIQVMIDNNNTNLQNSVNNINTQLSSTLNTSLESLGSQLAAVSEKFVSDYTPLTRELQKVVAIAKGIG